MVRKIIIRVITLKLLESILRGFELRE